MFYRIPRAPESLTNEETSRFTYLRNCIRGSVALAGAGIGMMVYGAATKNTELVLGGVASELIALPVNYGAWGELSTLESRGIMRARDNAPVEESQY